MGRPPCCDKSGVKKGPWTPEEDIILVSYVQEHGPGNWRDVPNNTGLLRCSKSCRLRWTNYLRPGIKRGNFTEQEEKMIIHLQALLGNRWAAITSYLPQRTDNDIKNYWNTHLKKKLKKLHGNGGYCRHGVSSSDQISRGQWERKLQTDINMAKQALSDALSPENSSGSSLTELKPIVGSIYAKPGGYASSTENIAKMLNGWTRKSPLKPGSTGTEDYSGKEEQKGMSESESEAFGPLFSLEPFDSSNSNDFSQSMSTEASLSLQDETKPDLIPQADAGQLSLFEKWLFDDAVNHGKDCQLSDILLLENPMFF